MNGLWDWSLVRSFLAVLEHGSLLAAARQLQTSQPVSCYVLPSCSHK